MLLKYMKLIIRSVIISMLLVAPSNADIYSDVLRQKIAKFGYEKPTVLENKFDPDLAEIGAKLFENESLSFNSNISCKSCHLDEFSSADGLPNAVGVGGVGSGIKRLQSDGLIVPRNVLPLWGRGIEGFDVLFWDGKVEKTAKGIISQFQDGAPSNDPLVVAAHLPLVEIREMVVDTPDVNDEFKKEKVEAGYSLLNKIIRREQNSSDMLELASHFGIEPSKLTNLHLGEALAAHIRNKFQLKTTTLNQFMEQKVELDTQQIQGGLLFYGKGRCIKCHNGPVFSDLTFHAIAFPQIGFGKNGFGIDYGRFNVTDNASDLYKFRTPPLIEVANTAPYGHSGSLFRLGDAIKAHFDPLSLVNIKDYEPLERVTFFHLLQKSNSQIQIPFLDEKEIIAIEKFLETLSFSENVK